jgi:hypothetical protein
MAFPLPHGLRLGDFVMLLHAERGPLHRGLLQLVRFIEQDGTQYLEVDAREQYRSGQLDAMWAQRLEPVIAHDRAARLLGKLFERDEVPLEWSQAAYVECSKILDLGSLDEMVAQLAKLYAMPAHSYGTERMMSRYEDVVVAILARATSEPFETVRARLRVDVPKFQRRPDEDLESQDADMPSIDGFESLYPLQTTGTLVIGQRLDIAAAPTAIVSVRPGRWFAYRTLIGEDGEDEQAAELLLAHESAIASPAERAWHRIAELTRVTRGGALQIFDSEAVADEGLIDQAFYLAGTCAYGGRVLCVEGERWEGAKEILASPNEGLPTALRLSLGRL